MDWRRRVARWRLAGGVWPSKSKRSPMAIVTTFICAKRYLNRFLSGSLIVRVRRESDRFCGPAMQTRASMDGQTAHRAGAV